MPKVSVIIPVYNVEKYLRQCIESIINQTLNDIEVICVNDGSSDLSLDILNEYQARDKRVIVVSQKNKGTGVARNVGIEKSSGECLVFVDPDDWLELNALEELYNLYKENDVDIVSHNHTYIDEANDKRGEVIFSEHAFYCLKTNIEDNDIYDWERINNKGFSLLPLASWGRLYSANFIKGNNIKFAPNKCSEDNIFTIKSFMLAKGILYTKKVLYNYRVRVDSCSHKISSDNFCIFDNIKLLKDFLIEKNWFDKYEEEYFEYAIYILLWHYKLVPSSEIRKYLRACKKVLPPKKYKILLKKTNQVPYLEKIFSVKNVGVYKKFSILGFNFKIKVKKLVERERLSKIINNQRREIDLLYQILEEQKKYENVNKNEATSLRLAVGE